jgi:ribosomal protein S27AE
MICPRCGTEMNHHADKIDYTDAFSEDEPRQAELGGVVKEIHTCPKCGHVEAQTARS